MKNWLYIAGLSLALGNMSPAQAQEVIELDAPYPAAGDADEAQALGQEFLKTATEMWFLLSGISNREDADEAAPRFLEKVRITFELDNKLSSMPLISPEAACAGIMDGVQMRILETLDDLHAEFLSLCRANCYGSALLSRAFEEAVSMGMFAETDVELLQDQPAVPLTEEESDAEIRRIENLLEPDREVLRLLESVQDVRTASEAAPALLLLTRRFEPLVPPGEEMGRRAFTPATAMRAREAMTPIEPILWGIRSEIVRIAALPGYEAETYDEFSDALDAVFELLGSTHCHLFESVFDASFRSDLESALQENSISTN